MEAEGVRLVCRRRQRERRLEGKSSFLRLNSSWDVCLSGHEYGSLHLAEDRAHQRGPREVNPVLAENQVS